jgi:hypothetical protein
VIFELAVIIGLLVFAGFVAKKKIDDLELHAAVLFAYLDKLDRTGLDIKRDIDVKFGPDLVEKLNAIFKVGAHPNDVVLGEDKKFHKVNRAY